MKRILIFLFTTTLTIFGNASAAPRVCSETGCISGTIRQGFQTDYFEAFMGIPFAKPPVGELRFAVRVDSHFSVF